MYGDYTVFTMKFNGAIRTFNKELTMPCLIIDLSVRLSTMVY